MKYGLSEEQLAEICNIIGSYPQIEAAVIHGSRADGTYKEASDVDIAIKGEKTNESLAAKLKFHLEEETYLPFFFDVIAYNAITSTELKNQIKIKGKTIYRRGWREVKLGDAPLEIIDGDRGKNYPKNEQFFSEGYCLFLNTKNVTKYGFNFSECYFISREKDNKLKKGKLRRNDTVLTTRGTVGNVAFYDANVCFDHIRINSGMVIVRPKGINPEFNFQLFKYLNKHFLNFSSGSAQPQLPIKDLKEIMIALPPLPEQKAIAEVLSSLDDKIDLLHRQNKTLENMAQILFQKWFIEDADDTWEEKPLADLLDFLEGPGIRNWQYTEKGTRFINIRLIQDGEIDVKKSNFISDEEANGKYKHFSLQERDMVVSTSGTLGKVAIVRSYHLPLMLNTSVIRFRPKDGINYSFMYQYLQSKEFKNELESLGSGSVQKNFGPTHLKMMKMRIPPERALNDFRNHVDDLYSKLLQNYSHIYEIETIKNTLAPKLMSGKARVVK